MKKIQLIILFLVSSLVACNENVENENKKIIPAEDLQHNYHSKSLIIKTEEEKYHFQWASDLRILLTGKYGENNLQLNYPVEDFFEINTDSINEELKLSFQNEKLDFQIRNIKFHGRTITYEVFYKRKSLKKAILTTSGEIAKVDFFSSIPEKIVLNNAFIKEEISQNNCPHCISLLSYMLFSNVNEVKAKQKEPWYKQLFS